MKVVEDRQKTTDEDHVLLASWRRGDMASFEALVRKYQKRVLNIAFRITNDYEDACEVTQDTFIAAYKGINNFRGAASFSTWLTSIALNLSRNRYQQTLAKKKNELNLLDGSIGDSEGWSYAERPSSEPTALEHLERKAVHERLLQCLKALSCEFREIIVLRDLQDYSYRDICTILELREGTVKSRLFRARDLVRDCLRKGLREM
jgi:RNA polymerase sigma-70 factor (ECF subfamily)